MKLLVALKDKVSSGASGDWSDKSIVKSENGIVSDYIDKSIDKVGDKITDKLAQYGAYVASDIVSVLEFGVIGYGMYQCIHTMFTGNKSSNGGAKPMDKIMLSYFIFFMLRIINTVIRVRGGIIGN